MVSQFKGYAKEGNSNIMLNSYGILFEKYEVYHEHNHNNLITF